MNKYVEALNSISNYEIWHDATYDEDGYSNFDDYTEYPFDDSEDIKLLSKLINKYDILNKGIDELIEKYEDMVKLFDGDSYIQTIPIEMLEDLEKLKGE